jgi:S-adenosylmethionine uptake transporter
MISSLLIAWSYARAEAQRLVPVEFTAFIWAAILGAIVFGEIVLPLTVLGAAMIVGGCVIAARARHVPAPLTEAAS